jgi:CHAT domain
MTATIEVSWLEDQARWKVDVRRADGSAGKERHMAAYRDRAGDYWPVPDPMERPVDRDARSWDVSPDEFRLLAEDVRSRRADGSTGERFGRYLFDALLGPELWAELDRTDGLNVVHLALPTGLLQGLAWELMHDGHEYLALRKSGQLVLPRVVGSHPAQAAALARSPRVLFAVGSRLEDPDVQAGTEVMAVLRDVGRKGDGVVSTRVLSDATLSRLTTVCADVEPDVVHLIGHGRWDANLRCGMLTLRRDGRRDGEDVGAAQLASALGRPTLVVLSACDAAVSTAAGAPLAAELAAHGTPIVVAMAGTIGDTACRIFARSVVAAVAQGRPLFTALAQGRAAVVDAVGPSVDTVDWALPTVFTNGRLDPGFRLTDVATHAETREAVRRHGLNSDPLFAGRHEILAEFDALLGSGDPSALLLVSEYDGKVGGTRTLRELAAAAIRAGHLPILCGQFGAGDAPTSLGALAGHIVATMWKIAGDEEIARPTATLELCEVSNPAELGRDPTGVDDDRLARELRKDMVWLRDQVHEACPTVFDANRAPVLLLDDVHHFGTEYNRAESALRRLLSLIGPGGFGRGRSAIPVVLFGYLHRTVGPELRDFRTRHLGERDKRFVEMRQLTDLKAGHLAFLSWLLNPSEVPGWPQKIATPVDGSRQWIDSYELAMVNRDFYDPRMHEAYLRVGIGKFLVEHDDNSLLKTAGLAG